MLRDAHREGFEAALRLHGVKTADVATPLQPHQQRVVDRLQDPDQPGLVAIHGLGSGKTLSALAAQDALGTPATYVVPAALRANIKKEQARHLTGDVQPSDIVSMQGMASKRQPVETPLMVVDEAHRARDPESSLFEQLAKSHADKRLLLTGSPFYNHPADIAPLIDLAANKRVMPLDRQGFSNRYITDKEIDPGFFARMRGVQPGTVPMLNEKRKKELQEIFKKWTDYHPGSMEGFPEVTHEDVRVPMSSKQLGVYDTVLKKAPWWVSYKVKAGLPPSKAEAKELNAFLSGTRQISNSTSTFQPGKPAQEPKIQAAFDRLKATLDADPAAKAVIYSNFLQTGIAPYRQRLEEAKIPFGEFTGQMPHGQRDQMVQDYNAGKLKALLLSSAGGEGLDLKGTRLMQLLEPHWNRAKTDQVEGRGARYKSHEGLPPEARKMLVERYYATRPASGILERMGLKKPGGSVDEYLAQLGGDKEKLIGQFRQLLESPQGSENSTNPR